MIRTLTTAIAALAAAAALAGPARAQSIQAPATGSATATPDNAILLTVFLRHDQSRPLSELNQQLARQGFYKAFPPAGMEVVSWNVVMGIGQVIVLRLPPPACGRSTGSLRIRPGVPTGRNSIRPTITGRSASRSTKRPADGALRPHDDGAAPSDAAGSLQRTQGGYGATALTDR